MTSFPFSLQRGRVFPNPLEASQLCLRLGKVYGRLSPERRLSVCPGGCRGLHILRGFQVLHGPLEPRPRPPPCQLRVVGVLRAGEEVGQSDELRGLRVGRFYF